jgi:hypothetical protein
MVETNSANGKVPAYRGTIFISYARADDERPPFDETTQGWVRFFWEQLRWELTNAGVHQARLWLDRYEIDPTEDFTQKIEDAIRDARLIMPILSPNWVQRQWCQKEVSRFVELRALDREREEDNIILVKKLEPPQADIPEYLKNREGYRFFESTASGQVREFYWRGLQDQKAYFTVLKQIASSVAAKLLIGPPADKTAAPLDRPVVYVAAPADELRDAWQRVVNDLERAGFAVLPKEGRLPDTAAAAEAAIRTALAGAVLSVHLLGESEGVTPEGARETAARLQLRVARELAACGAALPRVLWAPKWVPGQRDMKRDPFEVVRRFGELQSGEEVYAEEVTDLSQWLRDRLRPSQRSGAIVTNHLFVAGAVRDDDELVSALANRAQSEIVKVQPLFAGDKLPAEGGTNHTVAIVVWGAADRPSIEALLSDLAPVFRRLIVLTVPGGDDTAKRRFFREGTYVERLPALPADLRSTRELLLKLEITTAPGGAAA